MKQGYAAGTIRIVLNGCDLGGDAIFIPTKVYEAIFALVAATNIAGTPSSLGYSDRRFSCTEEAGTFPAQTW